MSTSVPKVFSIKFGILIIFITHVLNTVTIFRCALSRLTFRNVLLEMTRKSLILRLKK